MRKNVYCILGRTAVGKDTVVRELMERNGLKQVVSYSTRPRRIGEGDTHIFIDKEDVCKFSDIVAYTKIGEYEYFATKKQLEECDIYIIDPDGYKMLVSSYYNNDFKFIPILLTVPADVEMQRAMMRGDNLETFKKRCIDEDKQFKEFEDGFITHYTVDAFDKHNAIECIENIMKQQ